MSRAFVKEDGPEALRLPDLPLSPHPNHVTPDGLAQLRARLTATQNHLATLRARPDRLDRHPEAAAERDIRWLDSRLASAFLVPPPVAPGAVVFGVRVRLRDDAGQTRVWRIVGEDEADAAAGLLSVHSPLARALLGAEPGERIAWRQGGRDVILTVRDLD